MALRKWRVAKFNEPPEEIAAADFGPRGDFTVFLDGGGVVAQIRTVDIDRIDRIAARCPQVTTTPDRAIVRGRWLFRQTLHTAAGRISDVARGGWERGWRINA